MKMKQEPRAEQPLLTKNFTHFIGIDPGVNTGFACYCRSSKTFLELKTIPIHAAMDLVKDYEKRFGSYLFVRVEDPRQATFGRNSFKDFNKAQGAGSVKRDAKIWEDFLADNFISFQMVRPNKKATKLSAQAFAKVTKCPLVTNEHNRDAGMLVFGF